MRLSCVIFKQDGWSVAQCVEVDVASQGNSSEEALHNVSEALDLYFETPMATSPRLFAFRNRNEEILRFPSPAVELMFCLPDGITASIASGTSEETGGDLAWLETVCSDSFRRVRFALESAGLVDVYQKGNHAKFVRVRGAVVTSVVVPHYTMLSRVLVQSIIRQSGLARIELGL